MAQPKPPAKRKTTDTGGDTRAKRPKKGQYPTKATVDADQERLKQLDKSNLGPELKSLNVLFFALKIGKYCAQKRDERDKQKAQSSLDRDVPEDAGQENFAEQTGDDLDDLYEASFSGDPLEIGSRVSPEPYHWGAPADPPFAEQTGDDLDDLYEAVPFDDPLENISPVSPEPYHWGAPADPWWDERMRSRELANNAPSRSPPVRSDDQQDFADAHHSDSRPLWQSDTDAWDTPAQLLTPQTPSTGSAYSSRTSRPDSQMAASACSRSRPQETRPSVRFAFPTPDTDSADRTRNTFPPDQSSPTSHVARVHPPTSIPQRPMRTTDIAAFVAKHGASFRRVSSVPRLHVSGSAKFRVARNSTPAVSSSRLAQPSAQSASSPSTSSSAAPALVTSLPSVPSLPQSSRFRPASVAHAPGPSAQPASRHVSQVARTTVPSSSMGPPMPSALLANTNSTSASAAARNVPPIAHTNAPPVSIPGPSSGFRKPPVAVVPGEGRIGNYNPGKHAPRKRNPFQQAFNAIPDDR